MAMKLDGKLKKYANVSEVDRANFFLVKRTENFKLDRDTLFEILSQRMEEAIMDMKKYPTISELRRADQLYIVVMLRNNYTRLCRDYEKYDINVESFIKVIDKLLKENKVEYEVQAQDYEEKFRNGESTPSGNCYSNKATDICAEICKRALTLCSTIKLENIRLSNPISTIDID